MHEKSPEVADAERRLGWACGYHAFLEGKASPWQDGKSSELRVHQGQHFKYGYKQGFACAEEMKGAEVQTEPDW